MAMPAQKPGLSEQAVGTPRVFLDAVEMRFGPITIDLAANADNSVCAFWLGPGSSLAEDSLALDWSGLGWGGSGLYWLNPPYEDIAPWARKAAIEGALGATIAMLVPASIGSNWFRHDVYGQALVIPLSPRLKFVGHTKPYPKDLMLCIYGPWIWPGFAAPWRWNEMSQLCRRCGKAVVAVASNGGKAIARQCPLCLEFAPVGKDVGTPPEPKKALSKDEQKARRKGKAARAERQLGLFAK